MFFIVTGPGNWLNPSPATSSALFCDLSQSSLPSGAFFSLRCLIYKVHAVSGGTLSLYQASSRLSRTFFKSFLTPGPPRRGNSFKLPHLSAAVKYFFSYPARASPLADSYVRLPDPLSFVNGFFQVFPVFLILTICSPYFSITSVQNGKQVVQIALAVL